jgi:hypothetical protein
MTNTTAGLSSAQTAYNELVAQRADGALVPKGAGKLNGVRRSAYAARLACLESAFNVALAARKFT